MVFFYSPSRTELSVNCIKHLHAEVQLLDSQGQEGEEEAYRSPFAMALSVMASSGLLLRLLLLLHPPHALRLGAKSENRKVCTCPAFTRLRAESAPLSVNYSEPALFSISSSLPAARIRHEIAASIPNPFSLLLKSGMNRGAR